MLDFHDRFRPVAGSPDFESIYTDMPLTLPAWNNGVNPLKEAIRRFEFELELVSPSDLRWSPINDAALIDPIKERVAARIEGCGLRKVLPHDAELELTVHRGYITHCCRPPRVIFLLEACYSYGEQERYVFFDSEYQLYMLRAPALMRLRAPLDELTFLFREEEEPTLIDTYDQAPHVRAVYSERAFQELLSIGNEDFRDLPHHILRMVKYRMLGNCGKSPDTPIFIDNHNLLEDAESGTFLVDTHPFGYFRVQLKLEPMGNVETRVVRLKEKEREASIAKGRQPLSE